VRRLVAAATRFPARRTTARKRPKQARAQATVDAILDAAAQFLVSGGYARMTTNRVAARAGVSIGTLYQYFPTKDAVVAALVERHLERMRAILGGRLMEVATAPLDVFVREMIRGLFAAHAVEPGLHRAMLEQIPRVDRRERLLSLEHEMQAGVEAALTARGDAVRPKALDLAALVVCQAVAASAHAVLFDERLRGREPAVIEELAELVLRYLGR
jgi:AcrR family transcriptional regulator